MNISIRDNYGKFISLIYCYSINSAGSEIFALPDL